MAKKKSTKKKSTSTRSRATTAKGSKKSTEKKSTKKSAARSSRGTTKKTAKSVKKTSKKTTKKTTRKTGKKTAGKKTSKKKTSSKAGGKKKTTKAADASKKSTKQSRKKKVLRKITDTAKREAESKDLTPEEIRAKAAAAILPDQAPKKLKSPLTKRELKAFAELLLEKRAELVGDLTSMEQGALHGKDSANLSNMPLHMADIGSDNYEQELTLGLMESERKLLGEIDEALARINAGTYGVCEATGEPIGKPRLEAKPWAKYSIEAARAMERGRRF